MAGSMKDIKLRIKSVESTMQITKAMELVASSKMRRAKERVERSRPYFEVLHKALTDIAAADIELRSPYLKQRPVQRTLLVVIAGDRGLAGGYNANVLRLAEAQPGEVTVLPIGKRTVEFFRRRRIEMLTESFSEAASISVSDCFTISDLVSKGYLAGQFDEVGIVYTRFVSMLTQTPACECLLPLEAHEVKRVPGVRPLVLYEPSPHAVYDAIVPHYLAGMIYGAMCESVASELGARRTAMDAASKNAAEMIEDLSLRYNRARQGAITQEITEIVAGAEH